MTRKLIALIALALLAGCSGGGDGNPATPASAPAPLAQPDMLTLTPAGLLRGKASGQGQHLVFANANLQRETMFIREGHVVYSRTLGTPSPDIWSVRTDGTDDHPLVNTPDDEHLRAFNGSWMIYTKPLLDDPSGFLIEQQWSFHRETGAQFLLFDDIPGVAMQFQGSDRLLFNTDHQIFSETVTGTDRIMYTDDMGLGNMIIGSVRVVDNAIVYHSEDFNTQGGNPPFRLFSIPLSGGNPVPLESDDFYIGNAPSLGNRVVYERCTFRSLPQQCDVASIRTDGTDRVVLTSHQANEAIQGFTTSQVIIRRNLSGNDQLLAVPVTGGAEKLLLTMTDNEFVQLIVDDLLVVKRTSGSWTLDLNGNLKQIGDVVGDSGFITVGGSVCMNRGTAVWCMPLDGSGPQVKIADNGRVVGVL